MTPEIARLVDSYPRMRPPLPPRQAAIFEEEYRWNLLHVFRKILDAGCPLNARGELSTTNNEQQNGLEKRPVLAGSGMGREICFG